MRLNKLDLNLLVVLDAIVSEGGVTRASTRLRLTQAATSNALRRLREHFNDDLLVLTGGRMVPTPFAMSLAADVRTLVNNAHSISSARASFDPASSTRVFRIAMTEYVGSVMLPHLAPEWEKAAPHVVIEIKPPPDDLEAGLERGEFDFIIVPASGMGETSYPSIELFRDEYVCVAAADNAGVSSPITLDEYLAAEHAAFLPHGMAVGDIVSRAGIARQIVAIASPTLLPSIIKGGRRVATIQRRLAMRVAGDLDLKISALPFDVPPLVAKAYWHPIRGEDLARVWFRNLLLTCSREINALSG